ncbi:MAG: methyltransferase [Rudanella sp.]|nr:methyltransferase [Rudanella sp.]
MKVCTDACVLGAWISAERLLLPGSEPAILDIGTGTGLLALMAAQNHPTAQVDAVEIDPDAYDQATDNIKNSPFANRIQVHKTAIQHYQPSYLYDLILTNPPFITNHLRSPDAATNRALHTDMLPFADLVTAVDRLLKPNGHWWVLLPPYEAAQLDQLVTTTVGLYPFERLLLRHNAQKAPFRHITGYSRQTQPLQTDTLTIYEPDGSGQPSANPTRERYTDAFRQLLRPFYLIF